MRTPAPSTAQHPAARCCTRGNPAKQNRRWVEGTSADSPPGGRKARSPPVLLAGQHSGSPEGHDGRRAGPRLPRLQLPKARPGVTRPALDPPAAATEPCKGQRGGAPPDPDASSAGPACSRRRLRESRGGKGQGEVAADTCCVLKSQPK